MTHILIADDDSEIRKVIGIYLENEGYNLVFAENGKQALEAVDKQEISLVLLDVMMPEMNGIDACIAIREKHFMPIIFLTAKGGDLDKIQGLAVGADDYMAKPFNAMELIARVKSQLRRYTKYSPQVDQQTNKIEVGNLLIDTDTRQVFVGGKDIRLTPKEFDILTLLAKNKGMVFSLEKIYQGVWGDTYYRSDNTIMVHITKIREKIEADPKKPIYIKTVWGVGYKV
ncbi:MAG: response regulator transcription factor [Bacilli bacterium]